MEKKLFEVTNGMVKSYIEINTRFDVSEEVVNRIKEIEGVCQVYNHTRYKIEIEHGKLFSKEEIKAEVQAFFEDLEIVKEQ